RAPRPCSGRGAPGSSARPAGGGVCGTACSGCPEDEVDRARKDSPCLGLLREPALPGRTQAVELGAPPLGRDAPLRLDQATIFETVERRVEGALVHLQHVSRAVTNPLRDGPAVQLAERENLE